MESDEGEADRRHQPFDDGGKQGYRICFLQREIRREIVNGRKPGTGDGVPDLCKKHVVSKCQQNKKVGYNTDKEPGFAAALTASFNEFTNNIIENAGGDDDKTEESPHFVIEKEAACKQKSVSGMAVLVTERQPAYHKAEKNPEVYAGKKKTVLRRESEKFQ